HPTGLNKTDSQVDGGAVGPGGRELLVGYAASQAGYGDERAVAWTGPDWTPMDLTPTSAAFARALGTDGTHTVGLVDGRAVIWNSLNPDDFFNLGQLLPPDWGSEAFAIDGQGNALGDAVSRGSDGYPVSHVVLWLAVPEPLALAALQLAAMLM